MEGIIATWFGPGEYSWSLPGLKAGLRLSSAFFLLIAMLGPTWGEKEKETQELGREIYFLLDVSASMNVEDVPPNRLALAKDYLARLADDLKGDRMGLIIFTDQPFVQCPLTQDVDAFKLFLELAQTGEFSMTGTQFRGALTVALDRFHNIEVRPDQPTRCVVLITDGEDFGDTYASLLERLKIEGILIFPVGVGTVAGGPVPNFENGRPSGFKRTPDNQTAFSRLVEKDLKELAKFFDTKYVQWDGSARGLEELKSQLMQVRASPLTVRKELVERNHFVWFTAIALICLMVSLFLMPVRKS